MLSETYFSDRERGERPRTAEDVPLTVWAAIVDLIYERISDGALGHEFPEFCGDGAGCCGCDSAKLARRLKAEIPELEWPLDTDEAPEIAPMMDLLEFCARNIGEPIKGGWHSYYSHHHLGHDVDAGRAAFRAKLDRLFRRNGVAFEMDENGLMQRLVPEGLREALIAGRFQTGDGALDRLLENARTKFLSPKIEIRREALEALWDGFERLKTVDAVGNKRAGIAALLDSAAGGPRFRQFLETEARLLTDAGNAFQIRHHEVGQEAVASSAEVDYLFHRLFALTQLLLAARGR
jgi:hypothetical protein